MEFVRKAALVAITPIFVVLLFSLASSTSVIKVATSPEKVKTILASSGIYETVVPGLLDEAGQISSGGEQVQLGNAVVRQAAEKTFTPAFVKQNTELVLDSIYNWLDGQTPLPDFNIDLSATRAGFAANVADDVEAQLAALPACPAGTKAPQDLDPFSAACLPVGIKPASEAAAIEQNINSGSGFLDQPVITSDSVKTQDNNVSLFTNQLKDIPEVYQKLKLAPLVVGILALLLLAAIILLSSSKRKGLRRVGVILLIVGLFVMGFAYGANRLLDQGLKQISLGNQVLEDKSKILITELVQEVDKTYWMFGIAYTALGISAIATALFYKRRGSSVDSDDLEGEGQTPEDRIDLKATDEPTPLAEQEEEKPAVKPKTKAASKKKMPTKIEIQ